MSSMLSNLFGKAKKPDMVSSPPPTVSSQSADATAEALRRRMVRLQKATTLSNLSQPNILRKTLGAG